MEGVEVNLQDVPGEILVDIGIRYEEVRANNIEERQDLFRQLFAEELKEGTVKESGAVEVPTGGEALPGIKGGGKVRGKPGKKSVEQQQQRPVRRSGRKRAEVNYAGGEDDSEEEVGVGGRRRKRSGLDNFTPSETKRCRKNPVKGVASGKPVVDPEPSKMILRPKKEAVVYTDEVDLPNNDDFVFCQACDKLEYNGCEMHPPHFSEPDNFDLEIKKSGIGINSGEGVFNKGDTIPVGILFGPYTGKFVDEKSYKKVKEANLESGNAWEIRDSTMKHVIGVCDPGLAPDSSKHWMSKINCCMYEGHQNLVAFQLKGFIYYKVVLPILKDSELQVFYGDSYAKELGVDVERYAQYKGKENHKTEGVACLLCKCSYGGQRELEQHLKKNVWGMYRCQGKQNQEMVDKAGTNGRKYVCGVCGKGFSTAQGLGIHDVVHDKTKRVPCSLCEKTFTTPSSLLLHIKTVHEKVKPFSCKECHKKFSLKGNMETHYKTHFQTKDFKCLTCGLTFTQQGHLTRHTNTVHLLKKDHQCPHCDYITGYKYDLTKHIKRTHLQIKEACTWSGCDYKGFPGHRMDYHRRQVHTREYTFECRLCEDQRGIWWGTVTKQNMNNHTKSQHPEEWEKMEKERLEATPEVCTVKRCRKRFETKVELERHIRKLH